LVYKFDSAPQLEMNIFLSFYRKSKGPTK